MSLTASAKSTCLYKLAALHMIVYGEDNSKKDSNLTMFYLQDLQRYAKKMAGVLSKYAWIIIHTQRFYNSKDALPTVDDIDRTCVTAFIDESIHPVAWNEQGHKGKAGSRSLERSGEKLEAC